jgi:hypothetical protein
VPNLGTRKSGGPPSVLQTSRQRFAPVKNHPEMQYSAVLLPFPPVAAHCRLRCGGWSGRDVLPVEPTHARSARPSIATAMTDGLLTSSRHDAARH